MELDGKSVLKGPRTMVRSGHFEGVMQHENDDAWRHSFRLVRTPPQIGRDLKPIN